jgi:cob(I)alamin adenosyltransferase
MDLAAALEQQRRIEADLSKIEKQIFDLETSFLTASHKGKRAMSTTAAIRPEDRVFSLSSVTSPLGSHVFPTAKSVK